MNDNPSGKDWDVTYTSTDVRLIIVGTLGLVSSLVVLGWLQTVSYRYDPFTVYTWEALFLVMTALSVALAWISFRRRRLMQEQIQRQQTVEEQFRQLAENIDAAFWLYDLEEERLLYVSPGFQNLLGPSESDEKIDWYTFIDRIHPGGHKYITRIAQNEAESDQTEETFFRFYDADGSMHWVHSRIFPVHNAADDIYRLVGIAEDITAHRQTEEELHAANRQLQEWTERLQQRNREIVRLSEMGKELQTCSSHQEAYDVIVEAASHIFPNSGGALYLDTKAQKRFEYVAGWNCPHDDDTSFDVDACWALRDRAPHVVSYSGLLCDHLREPPPISYICAPILAQHATLGVLHIQFDDEGDGASLQTQQRMAIAIADQVALALSNLNLRKKLSVLAVRDPLTGLYNRRYMERALEHEVQRAGRQETSLGLIMLDLDHFKTFNDTYGHSVGDALLRRLGAFLKDHVRRSDIVCRYGGEEFVILLPGASIAETQRRGEQLREGLKHLSIQNRGKPIDQVTASVGVAVYPQDADTGRALLQAADAALYEAKADGRDRLMRADEIEPA